MAFGFGFALTAIAKAVGFTPSSLFTSGEQGVWYDPSDFSTMFQDAAGTTPVTAVEQPVGLILDKSKGLVLGSELIVQPINFNANWIATTGGTPVASGSSFTTSSIGGFWINALTPGKTYQVTVTGTTTADSGVTLRQTNTTTTSQIRTGFGSAVFTAQSGFMYFYVRNESAGTTTVTSISVREVPGNHATQATTTSRPTLQQDAFGKYYLSFDGVDDYLVTGSINFTATDKMFVAAGVRKLSDAAQGIVAELSIDSGSNNGSFNLGAPGSALQNYAFASTGTAASSVVASSLAPITNVLSGLGNISGDSAILRVNGTQAASSTADQGTGNYGNYPMYIGRRGGTTLPFNGRIYSLIVCGKTASASEITSTENWVNSKTKAWA